MKTEIFTKQELDQILDEHKLWLSSGGEEGEKANLSYANLRDANLRFADLKYATLYSADLHSADLRSANLCSADLSSADLSSANLCGANLKFANLYRANLNCANLRGANLNCANLDFSAFPLWCGGLNVHIDDKIATQLLYHFVSNVKSSPYTSKQLKSLCNMKSIVKQANKFHRVDECESIEQIEQINLIELMNAKIIKGGQKTMRTYKKIRANTKVEKLTDAYLINNRYKIYIDNGVIYDTVSAEDIPQYIFFVRDTLLKSKGGKNENN